MKVFVCNDHEGWWPVPTASVIVAENKEQAFLMLQKELKEKYKIDDEDFTLKELDISVPNVSVLSHGDY